MFRQISKTTYLHYKEITEFYGAFPLVENRACFARIVWTPENDQVARAALQSLGNRSTLVTLSIAVHQGSKRAFKHELLFVPFLMTRDTRQIRFRAQESKLRNRTSTMYIMFNVGYIARPGL